MSASDAWVRVVARRLCGYRSPADWRTEAQRETLRRRQHIAERATDVQAARELLSLIECPTAADLQKAEQERERRSLLDDEEDEEEDKEEDEKTPVLTPIAVDTDISTQSPPLPLSTRHSTNPSLLSPVDTHLTNSPIPPLPRPTTPSPVQLFDTLLAADITVDQLHSTHYNSATDPIHLALLHTLSECSMMGGVDWKAETWDIFTEFRLFDERLHLTAAMTELEQRVRQQYRAAEAVHGYESHDGWWGDWMTHVIAAAVSECNKHGVRVLDCTGGDTHEWLLTRAEHYDRVVALIRQLGMDADMRPFTEEEGCLVCEEEATATDVSSIQ